MKKRLRFVIDPGDIAALGRAVPEFARAAKDVQPTSFDCECDLFRALVQSIVSQQLALRAADAVLARLRAQVRPLTPKKLLAQSADDLRRCGLSARKIDYLRGIAEAAANGRLHYEKLAAMPDADIVDELVKLKGVGVWTAEMLLIFSFGRPDVFSWRDLGVRRGLERLTGKQGFTEAELETYRQRVSPFGTLASLFCWLVKGAGD